LLFTAFSTFILQLLLLPATEELFGRAADRISGPAGRRPPIPHIPHDVSILVFPPADTTCTKQTHKQCRYCEPSPQPGSTESSTSSRSLRLSRSTPSIRCGFSSVISFASRPRCWTASRASVEGIKSYLFGVREVCLQFQHVILFHFVLFPSRSTSDERRIKDKLFWSLWTRILNNRLCLLAFQLKNMCTLQSTIFQSVVSQFMRVHKQ